jgi:hypothetical protein
MAKSFVCQDPRCTFEHSYCHTCHKDVCERGEADVHRSVGHEVQVGLETRSLGLDHSDVAGLRSYTGVQAERVRSRGR